MGCMWVCVYIYMYISHSFTPLISLQARRAASNRLCARKSERVIYQERERGGECVCVCLYVRFQYSIHVIYDIICNSVTVVAIDGCYPKP